MKDTTRNFLVGFFFLLSLGALAVLMVWFGEAPSWLGTNDWTLRIVGVREVRGIGEGAAVTMNGVEIGRVGGIAFKNPDKPGLGAVILANIRRQYSVPRNATAKVYGATLGIGTGEVNIVIPPGSPEQPVNKESATIRGEMISMIREIITEDFTSSFKRTVDHIGNLAAAATPVADNLADLLEERGLTEIGPPGSERASMANLSTVIERMDQLMENLNSVLGDTNVQGDVKGIARDLKDASEKIRTLAELWIKDSHAIAENVNHGIDRTDDNLNRALLRLHDVLDRLDQSSKSLAAIGMQVEKGEGTVGRLVFDDRLYESAVLALERLNELLSRLNRFTSKIEEDGYITVGQKTPVGTFTDKFPVGSKTGEE